MHNYLLSLKLSYSISFAHASHTCHICHGVTHECVKHVSQISDTHTHTHMHLAADVRHIV